MQNIKMEVKNNILTIEIDMSKTIGPSKSEKSMIVATTGGNMSVPGFPDSKIGINCYNKI